MIFEKITGHRPQIQALKNSQTGTAYLFSGPSGVGKKQVALALAQKILCTGNNPPCGVCPGCKRVEKRSHPDLYLLFPEEPTIKIETIREIQNFVNLKSFEKHGKVVVIDECQKMTPQSANALLKTLEEPPDGSHFILITSNKGAVLSTILSRCQKISFGSLGREDIKKLVPEAPEWALELSQGRLDLLEKWTDESKKELRAQFLRMFQDLPLARAFEGFEALEILNNERDTALFALLLWSHWLKQITAVKLGVKPQGSSDEIKVFRELAGHYDISNLLGLSEKLMTLEKDVVANVNRKLAFEKFWLDMKNSLTRH